MAAGLNCILGKAGAVVVLIGSALGGLTTVEGVADCFVAVGSLDGLFFTGGLKSVLGRGGALAVDDAFRGSKLVGGLLTVAVLATAS